MASNRVLNCGSRSTSRIHGAPQYGHAFSGEPARIHGTVRSVGNTAKWAPLKGRVGIVHTRRLLRPFGCLPHEALANEPPISPAFMPLSHRPNLPPLTFGYRVAINGP